MNPVTIKRALISVSNKSGIVEFARTLQDWNIEIIATGGTLRALHDAGVKALSVSHLTGFPEILDGRVKTLHPKIHAGLLAIPGNPTHVQQLAELDIAPIDLLVVNLYPFEETISTKGVSLDEAIEQVDIGGPAMLRAAAKNFRSRVVVVDPSRYETLTAELKEHHGAVSGETRFALAREAFLHTAKYDAAIANYLLASNEPKDENNLPEIFCMTFRKAESLRYGENPHQQAALYGDFRTFFQKLHGKELSYNNIVDIQSAVELVEEFAEPTVVIVKHTNPCGVGSAPTLADAYEKALATDMKSAFGGIVALNRPLDMATAQSIDKIFTEVVIAPEYPPDVLEFLKKKKDRRLIRQKKPVRLQSRLTVTPVAGGMLVQSRDDVTLQPALLKTVTKRQPTTDERAGMEFAWRVAKHVKSNAIVYARSDRTVGVGAGQMSRFDAARIAVLKANDAGLDLRKTTVASDAFFPFADGLLETVKAGATAVIQPGGSIRDDEVIKAADDNNIAMLFTGIRHFRH